MKKVRYKYLTKLIPILNIYNFKKVKKVKGYRDVLFSKNLFETLFYLKKTRRTIRRAILFIRDLKHSVQSDNTLVRLYTYLKYYNSIIRSFSKHLSTLRNSLLSLDYKRLKLSFLPNKRQLLMFIKKTSSSKLSCRVFLSTLIPYLFSIKKRKYSMLHSTLAVTLFLQYYYELRSEDLSYITKNVDLKSFKHILEYLSKSAFILFGENMSLKNQHSVLELNGSLVNSLNFIIKTWDVISLPIPKVSNFIRYNCIIVDNILYNHIFLEYLLSLTFFFFKKSMYELNLKKEYRYFYIRLYSNGNNLSIRLKQNFSHSLSIVIDSFYKLGVSKKIKQILISRFFLHGSTEISELLLDSLNLSLLFKIFNLVDNHFFLKYGVLFNSLLLSFRCYIKARFLDFFFSNMSTQRDRFLKNLFQIKKSSINLFSILRKESSIKTSLWLPSTEFQYLWKLFLMSFNICRNNITYLAWTKNNKIFYLFTSDKSSNLFSYNNKIKNRTFLSSFLNLPFRI